jgi:hypothetical protein
VRSSLAPRGRGLRFAAVEVVHELEDGSRYVKRYTGPGLRDHTFSREKQPNGRTQARLVVEGDEQEITPRYPGVAPVRR